MIMRPQHHLAVLLAVLMSSGCQNGVIEGVFADTGDPYDRPWELEEDPPGESDESDDPVEDVESTGLRYLMIRDASGEFSGGLSPGSDIDAISLTRAGVTYWGSVLADAGVEPDSLGFNEYADPEAVVGTPDSGCGWRGFTSLGGDGGYVIVRFGVSIQDGDEIDVYEVGPTMCPGFGVDESWEAFVGDDIDDPFVFIGAGVGLQRITVAAE